MAQFSHTIHGKPQPVSPAATQELAKQAFGQRLQHAMVSKGWNQAELARRASVVRGALIKRDAISKYINGKTLPSAPNLHAIALVLGVQTEDLVETRGIRVQGQEAEISVVDAGNGKAWLRINQEVEWPLASQVLNLLKGTETK